MVFGGVSTFRSPQSRVAPITVVHATNRLLTSISIQQIKENHDIESRGVPHGYRNFDRAIQK